MIGNVGIGLALAVAAMASRPKRVPSARALEQVAERLDLPVDVADCIIAPTGGHFRQLGWGRGSEEFAQSL